MQFRKLTPTVISYRDYKILSNIHFIDTLRSNKTEGKVFLCREGFENFCEIGVKTLNEHGPLNQR